MADLAELFITASEWNQGAAPSDAHPVRRASGDKVESAGFAVPITKMRPLLATCYPKCTEDGALCGRCDEVGGRMETGWAGVASRRRVRPGARRVRG